MMKKTIKKLLAGVLAVLMLVSNAFALPGVVTVDDAVIESASNGENAELFVEEKSVVTRDDGTWLFPVDSKYYQKFSDWCCCPGMDTCVLCGTKHTLWGDTAHSNQKGHNGIDLATPTGTTVRASASGIFYKGGSNSHSRGYYVVIEHPLGNGLSYYSAYQHLNGFESGLVNGDAVQAGDVIGYTGGSGANSGVHLHFGIVIGSSGKGISGIDTFELWGSSNPWATKPEQTQGRIVNNPADNLPTSEAGASLDAIKTHKGSVHYTFDKTKVSIGYNSTNFPKYNATAAIEYGKNHWNDGVGLCAEFVSNCLSAGGSAAWSKGCTTLVSELKKENWGTLEKLVVSSNGTISLEKNKNILSPGDPIFVYSEGCLSYDGAPYVHTYLYYDTDSNGNIKGYAHNNASNGVIDVYFTCAYCGQPTDGAYVFHMTSVPNGDDNAEKSYATIEESTYSMNSTVNSFRYLNAKTDSNGGDVLGKPFENIDAFKFDIVEYNQGYQIVSKNSASGRVVNVYTYPIATSQNGYNVTLWEAGGDASQVWLFENVGNAYAIYPSDNPKLALTAIDTGAVQVTTYSGASNQLWYLTDVSDKIITYNANGGTGAPSAQTKVYGTNLTLSNTKPTRSGYTFKGWSTSSNGNVEYAAGATYSANSAVTLYAVWEANSVSFSTSMQVFLNLEGIISMSVGYKFSDMDSITPEDYTDKVGLLVWKADEAPEQANATYENCSYIIEGARYNSVLGRFESTTNGIVAKELGDALCFRAYYLNDDGTYSYSKYVTNFSPKTYCYGQIKNNPDNQTIIELMASILNYGAAAQKYFKYRIDDLMNADLPEELK